ncbi:MAG: two-component regulator propeller domain-containing protein, partial [Acidobacteriota bacterium]
CLIVILFSICEVHAQQLPLRRYDVADGLATNRVHCIYQDKKGYIWIGTGEGLSRFDSYRFTNYDQRDGLVNPVINWITEDQQGNLWVGTNGIGVFELIGSDAPGQGHWKRLPINLAADQLILSLLVDSAGVLWIGSDDGLIKYSNAEQTLYTTANGLADRYAMPIIEDREGNLWIGTWRAGVCKLPGNAIINITTAQGLPDPLVLKILESQQGRIYASTGTNGAKATTSMATALDLGLLNLHPIPLRCYPY